MASKTCIGSVGKSMKSVNPKKSDSVSMSLRSANTKSVTSVSKKKPSHSGGGSVVKKPANPVNPVNPRKKILEQKEYRAACEQVHVVQDSESGQLVSKTPMGPLTDFQKSPAAHEAKADAISTSDNWHQNALLENARTFKSRDGFVVFLSCATSAMIPDGLMVMKKEGGAEGKLTFVSPVTEHPGPVAKLGVQ